jgi:hypothetical protein
MDPEELQLRNQQHQENQRRLETIEEEQKRNRDIQLAQTSTLAKIEANTACIPDVVERVQKLENTNNIHKGFIAALTLLWGALSSYIGFKH